MQSKNEKSLNPRGHFPPSLSLNNDDSTLQRICESPIDMTVIRAILPGSQETRFKLPYK